MVGRAGRPVVDIALLLGLGVALGTQLVGAFTYLSSGSPFPLATMATTTFLVACMVRLNGPLGAALFLVLVLAIPFAAEFPGVVIGIPFGAYRYVSTPGPMVLGLVPVFIYLAWVSAVYPVTMTTTLALGRSSLKLAPLDGLMAMGWDFMVEPLALRANYWSWEPAGAFYGVPPSNFLGWFLLVTATSALFRLLGRSRISPGGHVTPSVAAFPALILLAMALRYAALSVYDGFPLAALIGSALLLPPLALVLKKYLSGSSQRVTSPQVKPEASGGERDF